MILLLLACRHPAVVPPPATDPAADWAAVAARAPDVAGSGAVAASFSIRLETAERAVNAQGAMVVRPPDRFRVEISGPIGPPQIILVSDGAAVSAWVASRQELHRAEDAEALLRGLTGGQAGLAGVTLVLLGQLDDLGPPTSAEGATRTWSVADTGALSATVGGGALRGLSARDAAGTTLLDLVIEPGSPYPLGLDATLPSLAARAELDFGNWKPVNPPDTAFTLPVPPGVTVRPLVLSPPASAGGSAGAPPDAPPTP